MTVYDESHPRDLWRLGVVRYLLVGADSVTRGADSVTRGAGTLSDRPTDCVAPSHSTPIPPRSQNPASPRRRVR